MAEAVKLALFLWEGVDERGKKLNGEMSASSDALVRAKLRREGVRPLKVRRKVEWFSGGKRSIKAGDISAFTRQFATMLNSGVPLVQALDLMARGHENPTMSQMIDGIKGDVEAGGGLADALARQGKHFSPLYVSLVQAGEQSGSLESLLARLADYLEKIELLKSKVRKAALYPIIVMAVMVIIVIGLLLFVIPAFEELYNNFGAELPYLTKVVIKLSAVMQEVWWLFLLVLIAIIVAFDYLKKNSEQFRVLYDKFLLALPIFGAVARKGALARYARTLGTMYAAGTPLVEAMSSVAGACGNHVYEKAALQLREEIAAGTQLQTAMRGQGLLFPPLMTQMVSIGEESGKLDEMLSKVADFYDQEVDEAVEHLTTLMEPILILTIGVVVGTMVVAMYLPIFQLGQVV